LAERYDLGPHRSQGLVDILDRILDKGLVIAGDIRVHLANVELLTIQIRLLVCSVDKADQIGLNWWRTDPYLSGRREVAQLDSIDDRLERLEAKLAALEPRPAE
jgi:hypothetical protein